MSNSARRNDKDSTSSGHGALGMGGQPDDDPRDLRGGHEGVTDDDRTKVVGCASGSAAGDRAGGGSSNETVGVQGDKQGQRVPFVSCFWLRAYDLVDIRQLIASHSSVGTCEGYALALGRQGRRRGDLIDTGRRSHA
jgi:hypothetical protein